MSDLVERADGTLVLPSNANSACAMHHVLGWRRYAVGLDLGRNDPTALVVLQSECIPEFTGRGFEQRLRQSTCTVVFTETIKVYEYTAIADFLAKRLGRLKNWILAIDASGLGQPFSSTLRQAGISHFGVVMTAGSSLNRKGYDVTCAKTLLIENMATHLETGSLTIADDLPGKQELLNEIASLKLAATSAGNLVLAGGGKGTMPIRPSPPALPSLSKRILAGSGFRRHGSAIGTVESASALRF